MVSCQDSEKIVGVDAEGQPEDVPGIISYREEFINILSSGTKCNVVLTEAEDISSLS